MANPDLHIHQSRSRLSGLLMLQHWRTQEPPDDIGVDTFEFWTPPRRPAGHNLALTFRPPVDAFDPANVSNGLGRPTTSVNAWVADPEDPCPTLRLRWDAPRTIREIVLVFDSDTDHAMETTLMGHPENVVPFMVRRWRILAGAGELVAACDDNHQTINRVRASTSPCARTGCRSSCSRPPVKRRRRSSACAATKRCPTPEAARLFRRIPPTPPAASPAAAPPRCCSCPRCAPPARKPGPGWRSRRPCPARRRRRSRLPARPADQARMCTRVLHSRVSAHPPAPLSCNVMAVQTSCAPAPQPLQHVARRTGVRRLAERLAAIDDERVRRQNERRRRRPRGHVGRLLPAEPPGPVPRSFAGPTRFVQLRRVNREAQPQRRQQPPPSRRGRSQHQTPRHAPIPAT